MQLNSIQNIDYFGGSSSEYEETFEYDNVKNYQLIESQKSTSSGKVITKRNYYPQDYPDRSDIYSLSLRNIISKPVDVRTYVDNKLVSGQQIKYNNSGQPIEVYRFEESVADLSFNTNSPYTFSHKQSISYSSKGQIQEVKKVTGETNSFLWAYNNLYPVAKIENASYSDVETALGGVSTVSTLGLSTDESYIKTKTELLRTKSSLNDALITTYTYDPLKGMSAQTGPNGIITFYEYDDFGRLIKVKNDDGELLQNNHYYYAGEIDVPVPELRVSASSLSYNIPGGTKNVSITSNTTWSVSDNASWISVSPSSGNNNGTISITCTSNDTPNLRKGTVSVTCGNITKTISISQERGLLLK